MRGLPGDSKPSGLAVYGGTAEIYCRAATRLTFPARVFGITVLPTPSTKRGLIYRNTVAGPDIPFLYKQN
jgi:hypothetical protein